jgi:hypothetical protein
VLAAQDSIPRCVQGPLPGASPKACAGSIGGPCTAEGAAGQVRWID